MSTDPREAVFTAAVGLPLTEAFGFFSGVENLNRVTPDWFHLDPVTSPPERLSVGARIDYRFRWRSLRMAWRTRITVWEPPELFTYEQERGPYQFFRHEHRFEPLGSGTLLTDVVHYRTLGGSLLSRWLVQPELARIFAHRARIARELFPVAARPRPSAQSVAVQEPA